MGHKDITLSYAARGRKSPSPQPNAKVETIAYVTATQQRVEEEEAPWGSF